MTDLRRNWIRLLHTADALLDNPTPDDEAVLSALFAQTADDLQTILDEVPDDEIHAR